jgi:hypothetical protein
VPFTKIKTVKKGARSEYIESIVGQLRDADGDIVLWKELTQEAGITQPPVYAPIMVAMEYLGLIDRYEADEDEGLGKANTGYAWASDKVKIKPISKKADRRPGQTQEEYEEGNGDGRRRSTKATAKVSTRRRDEEEDYEDEEDEEEEVEEKPRRSRRVSSTSSKSGRSRRSRDEEDEEEELDEEEEEEVPRSRSRRTPTGKKSSRSAKRSVTEDEEEEDTDAVSDEEEAPKPRSGRRPRRNADDSENSSDEPVAEEEEESPPRRRRRRAAA